MIHIHKWSKWEDIQEGDVLSRTTRNVIGRYIMQQKVCQKCGKKQLRDVRT